MNLNESLMSNRLASGTFYDESTSTWSGPCPPPTYNPQINLGQALLFNFDRNPDGVAQICNHNGHVLTYRQLKTQSICVAENLLKLGYTSGDMVTILARNGQTLAPVVFGCILRGTPINPLDATFNVGDIAHMFSITHPKLVFCDFDFVEKVEAALKMVGIVAEIVTLEKPVAGYKFVEELFAEIEDDERLYRAPYIGDPMQAAALIMCSSGTTGLPKGVKLSHTHLLYKSTYIWNLTQDETLFCFSSIFWLTGICCLICGCLAGIRRIITNEPFTPLFGLQILEKYKVTCLFSAPIHMSLMSQHPAIKTTDLSAIRTYLTGGAVVSEQLKDRMKSYLPNGRVLNCYALTEICGVVSLPQSLDRAESCGSLLDGSKVKVIDDEGRGLGPEQMGEFYVKTMFSFLGYHKNQAATDEAIDSDGWLRTGDIGYMDKDGFLFMVDRKKDILKYAGYHVSPSELETVIETIPGVQFVCVVGIPGMLEGDYAAALVVKNELLTQTSEELCDAVNAKLADRKQIRGGIYFVDQLPRTTSGKVLRRKAREIAIELYANKKKL